MRKFLLAAVALGIALAMFSSAYAAGRCHINHQCMGPDDKTMIACPDAVVEIKKCGQEFKTKKECLNYVVGAHGMDGSWCNQKLDGVALSCGGTIVNNNHGLRLQPFTRAVAGPMSEGRTKPLHQDARCNAVIPDGQVATTVLETCKINNGGCHIEGTVFQHSKSEWRWDGVSKVDFYEGD